MRLTVLRAAIVALILLELGQVKGFESNSIWLYLLLFLADCFYLWLRHLILTLGLVRKYENRIYQAEIDRIKNKAMRNLFKKSKNDER